MDKAVNHFAYNTIAKHGLAKPTITAWLGESYAQNYEDVLALQLINAQLVKMGGSAKVGYIEIGANHPVATSSTYLLHKILNAHGLLVEPNPKLADQLRKFRTNDMVVEAAVFPGPAGMIPFHVSPENEISSIDERFVKDWKKGTVGIQETIQVPTVDINALLAAMKDADLLFLSVDVEGLDLKLLQSIDFKQHRPFLVQIEPSEDYAPGTSASMIQLMMDNQYALIAANITNLIFLDLRRI
jgi:FkbM family methyltransferase